MDDLTAIADLAEHWLETGWDRRLPLSCLDVIRELRYWRRVASQHMTVTVYCPGCDYEIECDAREAYRDFDQPNARCRCGTILQIRIATSRI